MSIICYSMHDSTIHLEDPKTMRLCHRQPYTEGHVCKNTVPIPLLKYYWYCYNNR